MHKRAHYAFLYARSVSANLCASKRPTTGRASKGKKMNKPAMVLKWQDEKTARPISRASAAELIRKNRLAPKDMKVTVRRKHKETHIGSAFLGVACCIYRAEVAER